MISIDLEKNNKFIVYLNQNVLKSSNFKSFLARKKNTNSLFQMWQELKRKMEEKKLNAHLPIQHFVWSIYSIRLQSKLLLLLLLNKWLMYWLRCLCRCLRSLYVLLLLIDGDARFLFSRLFVNTQCIEQIQYRT